MLNILDKFSMGVVDCTFEIQIFVVKKIGALHIYKFCQFHRISK